MRNPRRTGTDVMELHGSLDLSISLSDTFVMAHMRKPRFLPEILNDTGRIGCVAKYAPGERAIAASRLF
jgi:hypothetical protein